MMNPQRARRSLLFVAGALAIISLVVALTAPSRNASIDWVNIAIPISLLAGVAASRVDTTQTKARNIYSIIALVLAGASLVWTLLRLFHYVP